MARRLGEAEKAAIEQRLRRFYGAYYAELRRRMSRYPAASEIFPYYLKGNRRIIATLTKDGLVVVHYPAEYDSFEVEEMLQQRVADITEDLAIEYPNGNKAVLFGRDPEDPERDFDGAFETMAVELEYNGQIIRPAYIRLDAAATYTLDEDLHSENKARENAQRDAQFAADAYLMGLQDVPTDQQQDRVIAELAHAIDEFERVLAREPGENVIQAYLTIRRNQILLAPSALQIMPQVKLGSEYVPDFVIQAAEGQYVLVELERPALPLLTERGRPRAELVHAQQQVKDWFDWIGQHSEYARSILPGISEPEGWVVMGRRSSIPVEHAHVLARENAESRRIITETYDDLLDRARQHLENLRGMLR